MQSRGDTFYRFYRMFFFSVCCDSVTQSHIMQRTYSKLFLFRLNHLMWTVYLKKKAKKISIRCTKYACVCLHLHIPIGEREREKEIDVRLEHDRSVRLAFQLFQLNFFSLFFFFSVLLVVSYCIRLFKVK